MFSMPLHDMSKWSLMRHCGICIPQIGHETNALHVVSTAKLKRGEQRTLESTPCEEGLHLPPSSSLQTHLAVSSVAYEPPIGAAVS